MKKAGLGYPAATQKTKKIPFLNFGGGSLNLEGELSSSLVKVLDGYKAVILEANSVVPLYFGLLHFSNLVV